MKPRPRALELLALAAVGSLTCGGINWRIRTEVEAARREMARGRFGAARARLAAIAAWWPGHPDVAYQLGLCEQARGHIGAAIAAWRRVPPGSPLGAQAALSAAAAAMQIGRWADAEEVLETALRYPGPSDGDLRQALSLLYRLEGRRDDAARLMEETGGRVGDLLEAVNDHISLDLGSVPISRLRTGVEEAARLAPEDDRVWLGQARLAIETGPPAEAMQWLDACLRRRPSDSAVWKARLDVARGLRRADLARQALAHLQGVSFLDAQALELRAWFAEQEDDPTREQEALEQLLTLEPAHLPALERLATLAVRAGQGESAARYRMRP